jgi:hypothetical protein
MKDAGGGFISKKMLHNRVSVLPCHVYNFISLHCEVGNDLTLRLLFNVCAGAKHIRPAAAALSPASEMGGASVIETIGPAKRIDSLRGAPAHLERRQRH